MTNQLSAGSFGTALSLFDVLLPDLPYTIRSNPRRLLAVPTAAHSGDWIFSLFLLSFDSPS